MRIHEFDRGRWVRRLCVRIPALLASAYFIFWACAPPAALPPMTPMAAGHRNEVGLGAVGAYGTDNPFSENVASAGPAAQLWYYHRFDNRFDLGANVFAGYTSLVGGGAMLRYRFVDRPAFKLGVEGQGGWLYLGVGLPVAAQLSEKVWFYSTPSYGFRAFAPLRVPAGLSFELSPKWRLHTELGVGTGALEPTANFFRERYFYGALAGSVRF